MNSVRWAEYAKLGLTLRRQEDLTYRRLKCSGEDVHGGIGSGFPTSCLYSVKFCNLPSYCHLSAVANEDGWIRVHDTRYNNTLRPFESFRAHGNAIFDLVWLENELKLVTISGDRTALLWDLGGGSAVPVVRLFGHEGSVKAIACSPDDSNVLTTGGRDGVIMQWDVRTNMRRSSGEEPFGSVKADKVIRGSHLTDEGCRKYRRNSQCISSVVYQDTSAIISCSSTDKTIKVWDTRKTYSAYKGVPAPMHSIVREPLSSRGYTSLAVSPCRLKLYAYCMDATIYAFNIGTYSSTPIAKYTNAGESSFFCKINLSPDGRFVSSGSLDGKGYIWSTSQPGWPLVTLVGHEAEVTCIDWCKCRELKLASSSEDGTFRIWKVSPDCGGSREGGEAKIVERGPSEVKAPTFFFASHTGRRAQPSTSDTFSRSRKSPTKLLKTPEKLVVTALTGLPNYVFDGNSPHDPPQRSGWPSPAPESGDWLSRLIASTPPPQLDKPSTSSSQKRLLRSRTRSGKTSARGNLLKYFRKEPT